MISRPWATPELTSVGRLPMHSVPHPDRSRWTAAGASSCSTRPTRSRPSLERGRRPGLLDDAGLRSTCLTTPTSRCRFPATRRAAGREPHRHLRARLRPAGRVAGRPPDRPARRGRGERPDRQRQRAASRHQQGLAPGRRVRRHGPRPAGGQRHPAARREVVRRHLRRGPGPVVARRHHPLRVPLRHAAGPSCRRAGQCRAGRRPADRNLRAARRRRLRRRRGRRRAGRSRRGWATRRRSRPSCRSRTTGRAHGSAGPTPSR